MHLSIVTFLAGPHSQEKAKLSISFLHSKLWNQSPVEKSQWIRDAYKKYKVFLSNQRSCGTTFFYKMQFKKQNAVCAMLQTRQWIYMLRVVVVNLQASFISLPSPGSCSTERGSPKSTYTNAFASLLSNSVDQSLQLIYIIFYHHDHTFSFSFVDLLLYSSAWHKCTRKYWF